jgi:hypothetical protein
MEIIQFTSIKYTQNFSSAERKLPKNSYILTKLDNSSFTKSNSIAFQTLKNQVK